MDFTGLIDRIVASTSLPKCADSPNSLLRNKRMKRINGSRDAANYQADFHTGAETEMLQNEICALEVRLDIGWVRCEEERDPVERNRLEDHWIGLLGQYEERCDRLALIEAA